MPDTQSDLALEQTVSSASGTENLSELLAQHPGVRIHPTAIVEAGVVLGTGTAIWDSVHIRHDAIIGEECIVGEKTYIAYGVRIGNRCKINSLVYICTAVTIEDGVMISAGTIFTNDRFPRATTPDLRQLRPSDPDEHTLPTHVAEGATIGAGCVIGNNLRIGRFAMIGMGSLVTRSIPDFALAVGHPAEPIGVVCRCGEPILRYPPRNAPQHRILACLTCDRQYEFRGGEVTELDSAAASLPRKPR